MKKTLTILGILLIFTLLDNTLIPLIEIKGYYPSLVFTFAICYSIIQGKNEAINVGVFSGVLQDVFFYNGFGINCLTNLLSCIIAAYIGKNIFKDKKFIPIASVFILSIFKSSLVYIMFFILKQNINPYKIIFLSIYNMILGILMYHYIYKLCNKSYMVREWKF